MVGKPRRVRLVVAVWIVVRPVDLRTEIVLQQIAVYVGQVVLRAAPGVHQAETGAVSDQPFARAPDLGLHPHAGFIFAGGRRGPRQVGVAAWGRHVAEPIVEQVVAGVARFEVGGISHAVRPVDVLHQFAEGHAADAHLLVLDGVGVVVGTDEDATVRQVGRVEIVQSADPGRRLVRPRIESLIHPVESDGGGDLHHVGHAGLLSDALSDARIDGQGDGDEHGDDGDYDQQLDESESGSPVAQTCHACTSLIYSCLA